MVVDYTKLKKLREETGYSFSLVKESLEASKGDLEKARTYLKKAAVGASAKKTERTISQGGIFSYVHHNKKVASLVQLGCETDFVSGNDEFRTLGAELAMQAASVPAENVDELLKQEYIREVGKTVSGLIEEAITKFGEHIKIQRFARWQVGEKE